MKKTILISSFILLLSVGCSSIYKITDFPSKEKFYEDLNRFVKNKVLKVKLKNDSSITAFEGTKISNDSLLFVSRIKKDELKIKSTDIETIKYVNTLSPRDTTIISLKNGNKIYAENVYWIADSILTAEVSQKEYRILPLKDIKEIRYKNWWLGSLIGFAIGLPAGYFGGIFIGNWTNPATKEAARKVDYAMIDGAIAGPLIGGIVGALIGYSYIYEFNP